MRVMGRVELRCSDNGACSRDQSAQFGSVVEFDRFSWHPRTHCNEWLPCMRLEYYAYPCRFIDQCRRLSMQHSRFMKLEVQTERYRYGTWYPWGRWNSGPSQPQGFRRLPRFEIGIIPSVASPDLRFGDNTHDLTQQVGS